MRALFLMSLFVFAACSGPSPAMRGAVTREVTVENSTFSVHHDWAEVEVVRANVELGRAAAGIMRRGYRAIQVATGCEIIPGTFGGDPALMRARIFCPT